MGLEGFIGCALCILGSINIVLHAPEEAVLRTVDDVFNAFINPGFIFYICVVSAICLYLIQVVGPEYGRTHMVIYVSICSLIGSISVMSAKGLSVAVTVTFEGDNQFSHISTWIFALCLLVTTLVQMNYFNKALDLFSANRVTPVYYVLFTTSTIAASVILSQGFKNTTTVSSY